MDQPWIYIVLLGAAAVVYAWLLPKRQPSRGTEEAVVQKVEATLEQYMADIENDNDELIELVSGMKQEHAVKQAALQEQVAELRSRIVELERQAMLGAVSVPVLDSEEAPFVTMEEQTALQEPQTEQEPESIRDRYQELFAMHEQGKSVDYIAKQSGIQRGEVQLILQLAEREDVT
ncbi:DUF6115 domain-containing protein [Paenibacillus ottowii]|uniref:DUF2802 domain-containing protein n=1 Tax=Paenibacillus ottowii TaxID=2315729 RepID=A0ABY3BB29_9BACL|nr:MULTISPECIES: hypothetical protein [Paenibacillus]NEU25364.1 hypothetical protein [Paenibacillus polymyxa]OBA01151.1 hypothetical protein A9P44_07725 [Paenibacillus polymyxa]TQR98891.1 hypothetical protein FKV70_12000 [Paenibacillus ottowii]